MAGLVPAIHVLLAAKTWMPGLKPGMTNENQRMKASAYNIPSMRGSQSEISGI
jgi:hypothetical protein